MRKFRMRSTDSSRKIAVGNFRYTEFVDVVKIHDVGGCFHHDASKQTAVGLLLSEAIGSALEGDEMAKKWLGTYAVITYNVLGCVPDPEYINALMVATEECRSRHKGFYGIKEDISEEEDAEILKDVRETVEMEQELKDAVEKES